MIARIQKAKESEGFTLIELLVVMIIIGILAAVAIPIFLSQREKAEDTATRADVSTLGKEIATYYVDGTGDPAPTMNAAGEYVVDGQPVGNASNNVVFGTWDQGTGDGTDWCVDLTNPSGDVAVAGISYSAEGGLQDAPC
jgi:prepilin-type N-terminal cleavage/methylation domain-containing protein